MTTLIYIVGLIHLAAYAIAGFSFATVLFINWIAERFRLKAQMLSVFRRMLEERNAKGKFGG
jgi:hypothetical protein